MISLDELLHKYNITQREFEDACISWEELQWIYNDYSHKQEKYEEIMARFEKEYIRNTAQAHIHSYRPRVKDPEHLLVKIIRKRFSSYKKYSGLNKDNYENYITDIIGFRVFILFKEEWTGFHEYITKQFHNDKTHYISDWSIKYSDNGYFVEEPKAHIRSGDNRKIYEGLLPDSAIFSGKIYRSVHYTVCFQDTFVEIQLRTLYEESWGEIDHSIVYPYYEDDALLKEYSSLMNRLSGLADEMGSYFLQLRQLEKETMEKPGNIADDAEQETDESVESGDMGDIAGALSEECLTPCAIAQNIIHQ